MLLGVTALAFNLINHFYPEATTYQQRNTCRALSQHCNMSIPAQGSVYSPLDHSTSQIRLIILQPCLDPHDDEIRCSLSLADLEDENCVYEALSYEWGPRTDTPLHIWLDDRRFAVRPNLWSALWHLREGEKNGVNGRARVLWIDALCIDQENERERNHQVRQMGTIYEHATRVVAWTGPATQGQKYLIATSLHLKFDVQKAFEFVEQLYGTVATRNWYDDEQATWGINRLSYRDIEPQDTRHAISNNDHRWGLLFQVLQMPYWRRLWITQELVLAKDVIIQFGTSSLSFVALEHVLGQSLRWDMSLRWGARRAAYISSEVRAFLNNSPAAISLGSTTAFKIAQQRFERRDSILQANTILNLCFIYRQALCIDLKDKIFALLGMSQPCCQKAVPVDYGALPMQICYSVMTHQLRDHHSHFLKFTDSSPDGKAELFNIVKAVFDLFEDSSATPRFLLDNAFTDSCAKGTVARLVGRKVGRISLPLDGKIKVEKVFSIIQSTNSGTCPEECSELQKGDSVFALNSHDILILRSSDRSKELQLIGSGTLRKSLPLYDASGRMPDLDFLFMDVESLRMLCRVSPTGAKYLLVGETCYGCLDCSKSRFRFDL
ncbi:hypothetical protein ONS95_005346 [Cadophora gregata]|uniref:uncharacterized protein n=1 Tax=Cadophora gregata TaxID=51156 RepID=UPI0026DC3C1A|nr:uncharacterized protein ONS95_005346 [Cadophora gregata]KAK0103316.1 hypothetical protein ONS95_005346 [Cadophora gregata]